jgi:hypothetical protein
MLSGPWSSTARSPRSRRRGIPANGCGNVKGHYRLGQPFEGKRADFFKRYGLLDRDGYALSDKDLSVLGLSAKPRSEIAHGADRGRAGAFRKADLTEGRVTLGDAGAEPEQPAAATPGGDQLDRRFAHRHRHLDGALGWVGDGHGVVEEHHDPITRELVERALELADEWSQRAVVFAQEIEDFFGFGGFGEGGVAAQIAKHDDDFAAVALQDFLVTLRDDQFGSLWSEKAFQPSDSTQFVNLLGHPRLQIAVQLPDLLGALPQFAQQPRVLHRDDRLSGEVLQ